MIYTTLNKIRVHSPCKGSWAKLLESLGKSQADDVPLAMVHILDVCGVADCIWAMRSLPELDREWRLYCADVAEHVLHIWETRHPEDGRPRAAIQAGRDFADGLISSESRSAAAYAAYAAAAAYAAYADTAAYAAYAATAYADIDLVAIAHAAVEGS